LVLFEKNDNTGKKKKLGKSCKYQIYGVFLQTEYWFANDENNKKAFYIGYSLDGDGLWGLGQDTGDEESDDCH
jgi:hypothetical protein